VEDSSVRQRQPELVTPEIGAKPDVLREFIRKHNNHRSLFRMRAMERVWRNFLYYYGRQWIAVDQSYSDWLRAFTFIDELDDHIPRPVTNRVVIAVENEAARLGKSALKPHVRADTNDPKQRAAARAVKDYITAGLRDDAFWPDVREQGVISFVVGGTLIQESSWQLDETDLEPRVQDDACSCTNCGECYADRKAPLSAVLGVLPPSPSGGEPAHQGYYEKQQGQRDPSSGAPSPAGDDPLVTMSKCLKCGGDLGEFAGDASELTEADDMFGRWIGGVAPKGKRRMEPVSIFDFFPENGGVDVEPWNMRCWGRMTPRPLAYFEERFENGCDVEPESVHSLLEHHPILAEYSYSGFWSAQFDGAIFATHALHMEYHELPSKQFPMGRSIEMAGDVVLFDGELCTEIVDSRGKAHKVPRKQVDAARYKIRPREFWGQALVDDVVGPQNRINQVDSQVESTLDYFGSPNLMVPVTANMQTPVWFDEYGNGKILFYEPDINNANLKPEPIGGQGWASSSDTWRVREAAKADFDEIAGNMQVELGGAPPGVTAASALQYAGEKAGVRREPKARALEALYGRQFTHQMNLIAAFGTDEEEYDVVSKNGRREQRSLERTDLINVAGISVEMEPTADMRLWKREAIKEGISLGLYTLDSAGTIRRVLEAMEMPTDINEDANLQVLYAEEAFTDYRDAGLIPPILPLHDNWIQYQTLGNYLMGDEGTEIAKMSGWHRREVQHAIAGWEEVLEQRIFASDEAKVQMTSGIEVAPAQVDPATGAELVPSQRRPATPQEVQGLVAQILPAAWDLRIELIWTEMMEAAGLVQKIGERTIGPDGLPVVGPDGQPAMALPKGLRLHMSFEAVVQAHRKIDEAKKMKAAAGMAVTAAPGGSSTASGGIPQPGQASSPAPGQQMAMA
jgi:hypothetical protein